MRTPLQRLPRGLAPACAAAALAAALPGVSHAATITTDGAGTYTYIGAPGEINSMSIQAPEAGGILFYANSGVDVTSALAGCTDAYDLGDWSSVICADAKAIVVQAGDGDENITLSSDLPVPVTVDGGPGNDWIRGAEGNDTFFGGPGNDRLEGSKGKDTLDGGDGDDDDLNGADGPERLDGGPGNDHLDGGFGDDTIIGGPGQDKISGDLVAGDCGPLWCKYPYGNDTIYAQDGEVDSIVCGFGTDTVYADATDVVDGDCENVTCAGAAAAGTPVPGGKATSNNGTAGGTTVATVGRIRLAAALRSGLILKLTGVKAGARLKLSATRSGKVVARGSAKATKKGTATVKLKFTSKAKRALRNAKSVTLKISGGGVATTVVLKRR